MAGVMALLSAVGIAAGLGLPRTASLYFLAFCSVIWLAFLVWLWASLVSVGKGDRESRTSGADLIWMQILFFTKATGINSA